MHFVDKSLKVGGNWASALILSVVSVSLAACVATGPKVTRVKKSKPTEYFAESVLGVRASPRVTNVAFASLPGGHMKRLPRGGGRDMVGKPYKVRGKWYYPREDLNYVAQGTASWYGDAFHGRLTANGEIYDMNNLTAAHPTMPLPSYARVTNIKNGKSVIVRVNDRGPYASNRLVDLSRRAAQALDYTRSGTAQVKLEYIGRAPVHGQDDDYLLASYRDGNSNLPGETQPGILVALNQPAQTPTLAGAAFAPSLQRSAAIASVVQVSSDPFAGEGEVMEDVTIRGSLPTQAPVLVNRPNSCVTLEPCEGVASDGLLNGYADIATQPDGANAFAALGIEDGKSADWKLDTQRERILLGSYTFAQGKGLQSKLNGLAKLSFESTSEANVEVYATPVAGLTMDNLVRALWRKGYSDAFVVR